MSLINNTRFYCFINILLNLFFLDGMLQSDVCVGLTLGACLTLSKLQLQLADKGPEFKKVKDLLVALPVHCKIMNSE